MTELPKAAAAVGRHWLRLACLIGMVMFWLLAGASHGWWFLGAALIATVHSLPVAYWLGKGAGR